MIKMKKIRDEQLESTEDYDYWVQKSLQFVSYKILSTVAKDRMERFFTQ